MTEKCGLSKFNLGTPATYRIKIKGHLDSSWSDRLGGVMIENSVEPEEVSVSMLTGELVDQAALFGVLNNLYMLGLPLLSVEFIDAGAST